MGILIGRNVWLRLVQRRTIWCPTWWGSFCIIFLLAIPVAWWWNCAESFLSLTRRLPAQVLVVEGWIGRDGMRAAQKEFEQHGYEYIVATGGSTFDRWNEDHENYAEMAGRELAKLGVPADKLVVASAGPTESRRTYECAVAVSRMLRARGIQADTVNVFTLGPHARRSRLVFAKVLRTKVGVVSWSPPEDAIVPWWWSSERAKTLITETAGYVFEALFNSGRRSNSAEERPSRDPIHP